MKENVQRFIAIFKGVFKSENNPITALFFIRKDVIPSVVLLEFLDELMQQVHGQLLIVSRKTLKLIFQIIIFFLETKTDKIYHTSLESEEREGYIILSSLFGIAKKTGP